MDSEIALKKGEARTLKFEIKDAACDPVDASSATFTLYIKKDFNDTSYFIEKAHGTFDLTDAATGIVKVNILETDTASVDDYVCELKVAFSASNVYKHHFQLIVRESVE